MRKGSSNIEMVLAFVLFIGVVLFAIYFLAISKPGRTIDIDSVEQRIIDNISSENIRYTLILDDENAKSSSVIGVYLPKGANGGARVTDFSGNMLNSEKIDDILYINHEGNKGMYVFLGTVYGNKYGIVNTKGGAQESGYTWSSGINGKVIDEKLILALNQSYWNDYQQVKKDIGLGARNSFAINFKFNETEFINIESSLPEGTVFVANNRVEIARINGEQEFADIKVKAW